MAKLEVAVERVEHSGIIFLDEVDKVAGREVGHGPEVSREGVQRDLLPIIEGTTVNTRYGLVRTDHILFIGAGAFHVTSPSDLIPELQGRFPIRVELTSLNKKDFINVIFGKLFFEPMYLWKINAKNTSHPSLFYIIYNVLYITSDLF